MYEFLMDVTSISSVYTLYGSIILVYFLKQFWDLRFEQNYGQPTRPISEFCILSNSISLNERIKPINSIIIHITKSIRRKIISHDNEEDHIYLPKSTY